MSIPVKNILDLSGFAIQNLADPSNPQDAASKAYVDAIAQGWKWKEPVRAASTGDLTLSGTQTVDGVALVAGDRCLVKDQSTGSQNGIYLVAAGSWTRAADMDIDAEALGAAVFVSEGTAGGNTQWTLTTDSPIVIGTTALTWSQVGGGASYSAGNGISIGGGIISVDPAVTSRKASATVGDGTATAINVTHNLGTTDVIVQIKETGGAKQEVLTDWSVTDANTITVTFGAAPSAGQYRVTVVG